MSGSRIVGRESINFGFLTPVFWAGPFILNGSALFFCAKSQSFFQPGQNALVFIAKSWQNLYAWPKIGPIIYLAQQPMLTNGSLFITKRVCWRYGLTY